MEMVNQGNEKDKTPNMDLLMKYIPHTDLISLMQPNGADILRFWDARTIVLDRTKFFER
jgi:hypothetical protein